MQVGSRTLLVLASVAALSGTVTVGSSAKPSWLVSQVSGTVGPLKLGQATAADVTRFAGTPEFAGPGTFEAPDVPRYRALAYDCSKKPLHGHFDPGGYLSAHVYCTTIYYLSGSTHTLGGFWTTSPSFHTAAGTVPGMRQAEANRRERQMAAGGCEAGIHHDGPHASLYLPNIGGKEATGTGQLNGGTVFGIELESKRNQVGLLFC